MTFKEGSQTPIEGAFQTLEESTMALVQEKAQLFRNPVLREYLEVRARVFLRRVQAQRQAIEQQHAQVLGQWDDITEFDRVLNSGSKNDLAIYLLDKARNERAHAARDISRSQEALQTEYPDDDEYTKYHQKVTSGNALLGSMPESAAVWIKDAIETFKELRDDTNRGREIKRLEERQARHSLTGQVLDLLT
jgi:hypothetical protein